MRSGCAELPVAGGFDVVLHIADEERFLRIEPVFLEDLMDLFAFVEHAHVGFVEVTVEPGGR